MTTCPTCGQEWEIAGIELRRNIVLTDTSVVSLSATETTVMAALLEGPADTARLSKDIYAMRDNAPLHIRKCISMSVARLREKLKPIGYTVVNTGLPSRHNALYVLGPKSDG